METMERSKRRSRRSSTGEFKTEIRSQCLAGEQSIPEVGQDFDLTVSALDKWLAQVEVDASKTPGQSSEERRGALLPSA
jgi:transposase-like protein